MEMSSEVGELFSALAVAQAEIEGAPKDRENPHFRSKYADLGSVAGACLPALNRNGLSVVQVFEPCERGMLGLTTMLCHQSGQWVRGTAWLPLVKEDPQAYGSAATYARRYGLAALVGVMPEDDDETAATSRTEAPRTTSDPERRSQWKAPAPAESSRDRAANIDPDKATSDLQTEWELQKRGDGLGAYVRKVLDRAPRPGKTDPAGYVADIQGVLETLKLSRPEVPQ